MKLSVDRTRALLYHVATLADQDHVDDMTVFFEAMVAANETALEVTSTAMTVGGGMAFAKRNALERYFRKGAIGYLTSSTHTFVNSSPINACMGIKYGGGGETGIVPPLAAVANGVAHAAGVGMAELPAVARPRKCSESRAGT